MNSLRVLPSLILMSTFVGCSASIPTESQTKQCTESSLSKENKNRVKLVSFNKTNGMRVNDGSGAERYIIEYDCEVEITERCCCNRHVFETYPPSEDGHKFWDILEQGTHQKLKGFVKFEKTENGWRPCTIGALFKKKQTED